MDYLETKELYHHGIKGQKWGVRRYRNKDGSLTERGRRHLAGKIAVGSLIAVYGAAKMRNFVNSKAMTTSLDSVGKSVVNVGKSIEMYMTQKLFRFL